MIQILDVGYRIWDMGNMVKEFWMVLIAMCFSLKNVYRLWFIMAHDQDAFIQDLTKYSCSLHYKISVDK